MKHTAKYPFVIVRNPDGGRTVHHEDKFYDDLTRDPERRSPWQSQEDNKKGRDE